MAYRPPRRFILNKHELSIQCQHPNIKKIHAIGESHTAERRSVDEVLDLTAVACAIYV